jgi:hypothetical protein
MRPFLELFVPVQTALIARMNEAGGGAASSSIPWKTIRHVGCKPII